jgi:hypothetical protein
MRNLSNVLWVFAMIMLANSCEKASLEPETIDHSKDFLKELRIARSARSSAEFIRGEFDGKLIYFTFKSDNDRGWNTQFVNQSLGLDQISIVREDQTNSVSIAFYFQQANIFNRQLPYFVPGGDGEFAEMVLMNLRNAGSSIQGSAKDDFTFWQITSNALKIQISSVTDDTLEGTFEGYIQSNTGSTILVKNGRFRIKINLVEINT